MTCSGFSDYEKLAIDQIHAWKTPELNRFGQAMRVVNWPLNKAGDAVLSTPGIGEAIRKSIGGIVHVSNDFAQWTVRKESIYKKFRAAGYDVDSSKSLLNLDLEDIDKTVGFLDAKYKRLAGAEGAVTGATGIVGLVLDVPVLVSLNLRAIGEYATYYGFDTSLQAERLFAMNVLGLASSPKDAAKQVAMAELVRIAKDVAARRTWKALEERAFVRIIQHIARALGIRLTKAKLAQFVPIVGAVVGMGFNAYFTARVCEASYNLYRERFLAAKYGADVIEATVQPANDLDPGYEESFEGIPN